MTAAASVPAVMRVRALVPLLFLSLTSLAHAQVPGEEIARRAFEDGVSLEKKGDYTAALEKFKESERVKPTLGNRFHKAYCLEMTGKLAAALIEYEVVERAARDANKNDMAEQTRVRLEPLHAKVPQLSLKFGGATPKDAEVTLDGAPVAAALLDGKTFRVDIGQHAVAARAPGHESFAKTFTAAESSNTSIEISLPAVAAPAAAKTPSSEAAEAETERAAAPPGSSTLPIITTAGAVVLAAGGVGAFLLAGSEQSDLEKKCNAQPSCEDDKGPTRTFDALALGAFIGAAGLAALSVVLWTSKPSTARVAVRSSWVGLEGRF